MARRQPLCAPGEGCRDEYVALRYVSVTYASDDPKPNADGYRSRRLGSLSVDEATWGDLDRCSEAMALPWQRPCRHRESACRKQSLSDALPPYFPTGPPVTDSSLLGGAAGS
jgi:hypothetical protein